MLEDKQLRATARDLGQLSGDLLDLYCFDRLLGEVWVAMIVAGEPCTADELAEVLAAEVTDIQAGLRELEALHCVKVAGDGFRAEHDLLKVALSFVRERLDPLLRESEEALQFARDRIGRSRGAQKERVAEHLADLGRVIRLVKRLLAGVGQGERLDLERLLSLGESGR